MLEYVVFRLREVSSWSSCMIQYDTYRMYDTVQYGMYIIQYHNIMYVQYVCCIYSCMYTVLHDIILNV